MTIKIPTPDYSCTRFHANPYIIPLFVPPFRNVKSILLRNENNRIAAHVPLLLQSYINETYISNKRDDLQRVSQSRRASPPGSGRRGRGHSGSGKPPGGNRNGLPYSH